MYFFLKKTSCTTVVRLYFLDPQNVNSWIFFGGGGGISSCFPWITQYNFSSTNPRHCVFTLQVPHPLPEETQGRNNRNVQLRWEFLPLRCLIVARLLALLTQHLSTWAKLQPSFALATPATCIPPHCLMLRSRMTSLAHTQTVRLSSCWYYL